MNLLKKLQRHPVISGVAAVVAGVGIFAGAMHAWGPSREVFTIEKPASYITFNSITNNPAYGDERNFVRVKEASANDSAYSDLTKIVAGKEYEVYLYYHNNAAANLNLVAENTRVRMQLPAVVNGNTKSNGFIKADNAKPVEVWDDTVLTSDSPVSIQYVAGSATIHSRGAVNGQKLSDSIVTDQGALVGYSALDGKLPGCSEFAGYVTFRFKAAAPNFTVSKEVSKHGANNWVENYAAQPGETVDYLLEYKNTGSTVQKDVMVKDVLPAGMTYVSGSTVLGNPSNPAGVKTNDTVTTTGLNVGTYNPGQNAWIIFSAKAPALEALTCGQNNLVNKQIVETDNGSKSDTATVTVEKKCDTPTPVDKDVKVCEIATKTIKTIKESELKANPSKYADKDSTICKEAPKPEDKNITVCEIESGKVVTIKESVYNANKAKYADKDSDKCKAITVCEISSKTVITISKEQYNAHKDLYTDQNSEVCKPAEKPETPEVPKTDKPVVELPKTGLDLSAMSLVGAGALTYAGYAYIASRRG